MYVGFVVALAAVPVPAVLRRPEPNEEPLGGGARHVHADARSRCDRRHAGHHRAVEVHRAGVHRRRARACSGVQLTYLWFPGLGVFVLSGDLPVIVTIAWAVAIPNAVNLVDGLDGLAAGMVAIAATLLLRLCRPESGRARSRVAGRVDLGDHRRDLHRVPAVELLPGEDLHGRRRLDAARDAARHRDDRGCRQEPHGAERGRSRRDRRARSPCPSSSCSSPSSTWCWRSSVARGGARGSGTRTRSTCTTGCIEIGHGHRQAVLLMYLWSALVSARRPGGRV